MSELCMGFNRRILIRKLFFSSPQTRFCLERGYRDPEVRNREKKKNMRRLRGGFLTQNSSEFHLKKNGNPNSSEFHFCFLATGFRCMPVEHGFGSSGGTLNFSQV